MLKRFRVTKRGKLLHKPPHQNHFRAMKSRNIVRSSRKPNQMAKPDIKNILEKIPFVIM
ncbi:MAG: 50S ribosomal protein L35 [Parcubacteria group bacterium]|nr:50S ribosomal protein L35 [Parcubacteria group bacterium]